MRNLLFFLAFLPMPFLSFFRPWIGMLIWGWLALMNPHRDLWGFASTVPYNQIIAIATLAGWLVSGEFRKFRLDLTAGLLILLWLPDDRLDLLLAGAGADLAEMGRVQQDPSLYAWSCSAPS